jgi:hypothetical protein
VGEQARPYDTAIFDVMYDKPPTPVPARLTYIMQSNGGMATFAAAARTVGFSNLITFDMGGTSCDVALIKDSEALLSSRGKIEGRDLAVPMLDINTVSAGGGTIAAVDQLMKEINQEKMKARCCRW